MANPLAGNFLAARVSQGAGRRAKGKPAERRAGRGRGGGVKREEKGHKKSRGVLHVRIGEKRVQRDWRAENHQKAEGVSGGSGGRRMVAGGVSAVRVRYAVSSPVTG